MGSLPSPLRRQLETAVLAGRQASEVASRAAIDGLGVFLDRRPDHLDKEQVGLRNGLRAKWRQLGNDRELLVAECAYEQWHRLLFARFLAENDLLIHPQFKAPVTLEECEELAPELGELDGWAVAGRFAAEILPGIFQVNDPCVMLRLAPEGRQALERIIASLPAEVFGADDSLGWVYQYWQSERKNEVNASERKIAGADIAPVTQLFTENYMVKFLLENTLGAWWAASHPESPLVKEWHYLRVDDGGTPSAGIFSSWPNSVGDVTVMDPCCGSGHFLVVAFEMLWRMRMEAEGLTAAQAGDAVLRDNLFGLELDARCTQIAAFALALQAWKSGGFRELPVPNLACSGISAAGRLEDWKELAAGDKRLEHSLERLHTLFADAESLGSLIDPRRENDGELLAAQFEEVAPFLSTALHSEAGTDPVAAAFGTAAVGTLAAAGLLSRQFTLVTTNPPFLGRRHQGNVLLRYADSRCVDGRHDLATLMLSRLVGMIEPGGATACVTPQNWTTLASFADFRLRFLTELDLRAYARLGAGAFRAVSGEVVKVALVCAELSSRATDNHFAALDVSGERSVDAKSAALVTAPLVHLSQRGVRTSPKARLTLTASQGLQRLAEYAEVYKGLTTGDDPRFRRAYWELELIADGWVFLQSGAAGGGLSDGLESILNLDALITDPPPGYRPMSTRPLGRRGVAVGHVGSIRSVLYTGERYDQSMAAILPRDDALGTAILAYCRDPRFQGDIRDIDSSIKVTDGSLVDVEFDREEWEREGAELFPDGWPQAESSDPTQWIFDGDPVGSAVPLQVAVGRMVGYRWPGQPTSDDVESFVDVDGIVCLPSVAGEVPAAERLQQLLAAAFGEGWTPARVSELLEQAGSKKKSLGEWLRDEFFKQHCAFFGNRPFVWHIWDGQREGFSALVNYHRLDRRMLEKLTYTYLGQDWVERQRAAVRDEVAGAEVRLAAALELQRKLEAILEGERPLDIYVRWKPLHEQPISWEPDLNDGVRLNIRPFVEAGVLRAPFNIHWKKDRGKNPDGSERHNDVHLSLAEKHDARKQAGTQ